MNRLILIPLLTLVVSLQMIGAAFAGFFGFGSDDKGKSGLDFNRGYDINTVATISGRVSSLPHEGDRGQLFLEVKSEAGPVEVNLGPASFWDKKGIPVHLNDELSVKGSKAQGQDGKAYILTQKIVNRSSGAQIDVRKERGDPIWAGTGASSMGQGRPAGGFMFQGGGMIRGGGGMMRH